MRVSGSVRPEAEPQRWAFSSPETGTGASSSRWTRSLLPWVATLRELAPYSGSRYAGKVNAGRSRVMNQWCTRSIAESRCFFCGRTKLRAPCKYLKYGFGCFRSVSTWGARSHPRRYICRFGRRDYPQLDYLENDQRPSETCVVITLWKTCDRIEPRGLWMLLEHIWQSA